MTLKFMRQCYILARPHFKFTVTSRPTSLPRAASIARSVAIATLANVCIRLLLCTYDEDLSINSNAKSRNTQNMLHLRSYLCF